MPDTIIGMSVLQPVWVPGIFRLWFVAERGDGNRLQGWLFIRPKDAFGLPEKMPEYTHGTNSIWKFTRAGQTLHCEPSVNWVSAAFHNGFNWSTDFVEMVQTEEADAMKQERRREDCGSAIHFDLNFTKGADQGAMIADLRQKGILK